MFNFGLSKTKMNKVLITGGSGLIGSEIIRQLTAKNFEVVVPTRKKRRQEGRVQFIHWNPERNEIDPSALLGVNYVINLAGANLAEGRWTKERKEIILDSRIESMDFLIQKIKGFELSIKSFISASAIGYYGNVKNKQQIFKEQDNSGDDFLSKVCVEWENALTPLKELGIRTVALRIGLVLSKDGGLMQKILPLAKKMLNANFGNGKQIYPWIHLEDIARMFVFAIENEMMNGAYNGTVDVANQVSQNEFNKTLAKSLKKPFWLPRIPGFLLKLGMGEMSAMLLNGNKVSNEKIKNCGFELKYPNLNQAFEQILKT